MLEGDELTALDPDRLRAFISLFVGTLAERFNPQEVSSAVEEALVDIVNRRPEPLAGPAALPPTNSLHNSLPSLTSATSHYDTEAPPEYFLRFDHDCECQACEDPSCVFCQHNPVRMCVGNFREPPYTYNTDEAILATCHGTLRVTVLDANGQPLQQVPKRLAKCVLMVVAVDGTKIEPPGNNVSFLPRGQFVAPPSADEALLIYRQNGRQLLHCDGMETVPVTSKTYAGALQCPLQVGGTFLKALKARASCKALMPGRSPSFRLLARVLNTAKGYEPVPGVAGVVTETFLVNSIRAKGRGEGAALLRSDPVQKLPGVGMETTRKLQRADELVTQLYELVPTYKGPRLTIASITTVGEFVRLLDHVHDHATLLRQLREALKLTDDARWSQLEEAVRASVVVDNRVRMCVVPAGDASTGFSGLRVLFPCFTGRITFSQPLGVLAVEGGGSSLQCKIERLSDTAPGQRNYNLIERARNLFMQPRHPGWELTHYDSHVAQRGQLKMVQDQDLLRALPHVQAASSGTHNAGASAGTYARLPQHDGGNMHGGGHPALDSVGSGRAADQGAPPPPQQHHQQQMAGFPPMMQMSQLQALQDSGVLNARGAANLPLAGLMHPDAQGMGMAASGGLPRGVGMPSMHGVDGLPLGLAPQSGDFLMRARAQASLAAMNSMNSSAMPMHRGNLRMLMQPSQVAAEAPNTALNPASGSAGSGTSAHSNPSAVALAYENLGVSAGQTSEDRYPPAPLSMPDAGKSGKWNTLDAARALPLLSTGHSSSIPSGRMVTDPAQVVLGREFRSKSPPRR